MGGDGNNFRTDVAFVTNNYVNSAVWGGTFAGWNSGIGTLANQGVEGSYWVIEQNSAINGRSLGFNSSGRINPQSSSSKSNGFSLRCIRNP
jgi:hypothetical protein